MQEWGAQTNARLVVSCTHAGMTKLVANSTLYREKKWAKIKISLENITEHLFNHRKSTFLKLSFHFSFLCSFKIREI